jgi:dynein heavy chain
MKTYDTDVIFIDDVNMPAQEKYGAQPPIELLRQWMDHNGWYDRKLLEFKNIVDIGFICSMGPPGGGRNAISPRFTRHFNLISFTQLEDSSLRTMFGTILGSFLQQFANVSQLTSSIVESTIELYNTITSELLPTPSKSHYTFNLRDLAKVFQGVLSVRTLEEPRSLVRLWYHECTRVFQDRLVDDKDRYWFRRLLENKMTKFLKYTWEDISTNFADRLVYGDFMNPTANPRVYEEMDDIGALTKVMSDHLDYYNGTAEKPMHLVLFLDAIEHVARISRIIRQPRGHAVSKHVDIVLEVLSQHCGRYNSCNVAI